KLALCGIRRQPTAAEPCARCPATRHAGKPSQSLAGCARIAVAINVCAYFAKRELCVKITGDALMLDFFNALSGFIWGPFVLIPLLLGTGLYLTIRLGGMQFVRLGAALRLDLLKRKDADSEGDISHFQALATATAATVGTGNIVGVATAIGIGAPGALFWMWVTGLVGMATKYAEGL